MSSGVENLTLTPVQQFYNNSKIFITGGTGFFGKILLEKLLRSCPNVSTIYILIRQKKGKDTKTRAREILDDVPFQRLKAERKNFGDNVVGIEGDCNLPNLGMSLQDIEILKKEVNIIFHMAATLNFTEKLKTATFTNIRATRDIITLAHEMPNLKVLMHVSTAYSNCIHKVIEEKIYPPAFDGKTLITMTEKLPDEIFDKISEMLVGDYPNTYTFTKQIAEGIVEEEGFDLPVGIHRPGIAVSTYREPIKSWINNTYAATGMVTYAGLGMIRMAHGSTTSNSNVVPVDMCMNSLIAAAWDVGTTYQTNMAQKKEREIPVYHFESNSDKPIKWGSFFEKSLRYGSEAPSSKSVWFHSFHIYSNLYLYNILAFMVHTLPAFLSDLVCLSIGKPPTMMKMYMKLHKFADVLSYFGNREWTYKSNNVRKLLDKMSDKDREIFFADLRQVDWNEFLKTYFYGIRLYVLNDPKETIPEAKIKWRRLYWAHKVTTLAISLPLLWTLWYLFK
ncbi:fatty acyl-CoA reductase wat-like [Anoplophora glabripennis]|uniref:fatty acyl-CoA reductase wat-like n=1 Tax=Anoplophora glabripennis TaxID=217634 RepID=UPI000875902A|nr:fatty acyl-CoA reductase wat-like [Anoplophora glabripennis]XP_018574327.1 fatty acyl-CoA reductase wat-like [Anoplophora glabripennis]